MPTDRERLYCLYCMLFPPIRAYPSHPSRSVSASSVSIRVRFIRPDPCPLPSPHLFPSVPIRRIRLHPCPLHLTAVLDTPTPLRSRTPRPDGYPGLAQYETRRGRALPHTTHHLQQESADVDRMR